MADNDVRDALSRAAAAHACAPWVLHTLLRLERSQVGRFGAGGIMVKAGECIDRAASGEGPPEWDGEDVDEDAGEVAFESVRLSGFRQFASAELVFAPQPARPVVVIEAANGYGKSHLVEAVRFALRRQHRLDPALLHAHAEGDRPQMSVEVNLRHAHQGAIQVVRRAVFRRRAGGTVELNKGGASLTVRVGGEATLQDQHAEDWLQTHIPPEVLDYFVFDAESPVVEALSGQAGEKLPDVRPQVEAAIGVAPLRRAGARSHDIARDRRRQLDAIETRPLAAVRDELSYAREAASTLWQRFGRLDAERITLDAALDKLNEQLSGSGVPVGVDWHALEDERASLEAALVRAEVRAREALAVDLPLAMVGLALDRAAPGGLDPRSLTAARSALERVAEAVVAGRLSWAACDDAERVLGDLVRAAHLPEEADRMADLKRRADRAVRRLPNAAERAVLRDGPARLQQLAEQLSSRPTHSDGAARAVREARAARDELMVTLKNLHEDLGALGRQIEEAKDDVALLEQEEADATNNEARRDRLTRCATIAQAAADAFDAACTALVVQRIGHFEREASRTMRSLVHKSDLYDRIEVNPRTMRYQIVDESGDRVPSGRSVGERTLLALALVGGLRSASGYRFPLFVEAPLKTLDPIHHAHVVREFLTRFNGQTILLVKPEELDVADGSMLRTRLGQLFRIARDGSGKEVSRVIEVPLLELTP